jgi:hypothetical protein
LLPAVAILVAIVLAAGLTYFVGVGVRAIYREAARTSRESGHTRVSAAVRASLRMLVWAIFFGLLYAFLYSLGRRIGWWAVIPGTLGGAVVIAALLQADRLLTIRRREIKAHVTIVLTIVGVMAALASIAWYAAFGS